MDVDIESEIFTANSTNSEKFKLSVYVISEIVIAILAIVENFLVIFVFCVNKKLQTRIYYFVISLSVADLLVGLIAIPVAIVVRIFNNGNCLKFKGL